jgi:hypothetical protein
MANKLTAVEFLADKFIMIQWLLVRDEISRSKADEYLKEFKEKAMKIEKEQIVEAATWGYNTRTGEQYYNEKFGH